MLRTLGAFSFFTSKCASRHNGLQFFISHLPRWLRARRFSQPIFRPSGARKHWKSTVFRGFSTFWDTCIFFPLTLSLRCFFHLSILSEVWLLNFRRLIKQYHWTSKHAMVLREKYGTLFDELLVFLRRELLTGQPSGTGQPTRKAGLCHVQPRAGFLWVAPRFVEGLNNSRYLQFFKHV